MQLDKKETLNYSGGGKFGLGLIVIVTGVCSFLLGVIDGISNPKACNRG